MKFQLKSAKDMVYGTGAINRDLTENFEAAYAHLKYLHNRMINELVNPSGRVVGSAYETVMAWRDCVACAPTHLEILVRQELDVIGHHAREALDSRKTSNSMLKLVSPIELLQKEYLLLLRMGSEGAPKVDVGIQARRTAWAFYRVLDSLSPKDLRQNAGYLIDVYSVLRLVLHKELPKLEEMFTGRNKQTYSDQNVHGSNPSRHVGADRS